MTILALEFSSNQRSAAVLRCAAPGDRIEEHELVETGSGPILDRLEILLRQSGIQREEIGVIAVGLGPGSYTGIRSAIAFAQGWQLGREVRLLGISSADAIAAQACSQGIVGNVAVAIDAHRGEYYLANYVLSDSQWRQTQDLQLVSPDAVVECQKQGQLVIGPEVEAIWPGARCVWPRAAMLAKLGVARTDFVNAEDLLPIYLRQTTFVKASPARPLPD